MYCIIPESNDPFFNLAVEELLLKNSRNEYLILGVNSQAVIIGKHQSAHREVNTRFITENRIPVIRRISGGGTVYHDLGNLNFSFIRDSETGKQVDFLKYTRPVIDFLTSVGLNAKFEGKNDLKIDGLKISGNAEHVHRNRVLHHGTLLFSTSLEILRNTIRNDKSCYITRAVESNPSHVTNLKGKLTVFKDIFEFRSEMMEYFLEYLPGTAIYELSESECNEAQALAAVKYQTWEWNWAYGPEYTFRNSFHINGEYYSCRIFVRNGLICECVIEGSGGLETAAKMLIGCRHMVNDMLEVIRNRNVSISDSDIFNFFE